MGLAREVAMRIGVSFLVVDVAQTVEEKWIAIECNDGQEGGYAGVPPIALWNNLIDSERKHKANHSSVVAESITDLTSERRKENS